MQGQGRRKKSIIRRKWQKLLILGVLLLALVWGGGIINYSVSAQALRAETAAALVYEKLPHLPKANQYRRQDTKEIDPNNTLLSRLIRYHQDVKTRPTPYRFDWQLTMGDYLGVNEEIVAERYPGVSTLTTNPMAEDIVLVRQLSHFERSRLIDMMTSFYAPPARPQAPTPTPSPQATPPATPSSPGKPLPSQPGDADLLRF